VVKAPLASSSIQYGGHFFNLKSVDDYYKGKDILARSNKEHKEEKELDSMKPQKKNKYLKRGSRCRGM